MAKNLPTRERLIELMVYIPDEGVFIRRVGYNTVIAGEDAGYYRGDGYLIISIDAISFLGHRLAFLYMLGYCPEVIDHINGDPADNRWENLRAATQAQNMQSSRSAGARASNSGIKGVSWQKGKQKWLAQITSNRKHYFLGRYDCKYEAEKVVKAKRIELHGDFATHY